MAIKILAAADLHLGKRSSGIPGDPEALATKYAWQHIVDWAISHEIDAIALCGDIVDQNNRYFEAIGPLQTGFDKLRQVGIEVFMVAGNHDFNVLPQLVGAGQPHVHLLGRNGQWELTKFTRNGQSVQFLGWSFPTQYVTDNPLTRIDSVSSDPNIPVIGLLHADLDNPKSNYCPVGQNDLAATGIRTWILGHIHKPIALDLSGAIIRYPGSLQALSAKESGQHGFLVLTVEEDRSIDITTVPVSIVRYDSLDIDIGAAVTEEALRTILTDALMEDSSKKLPALENVRYLSYDLYLVGEHENGAQVLQWATQSRSDYAVPIASGTTVFVRSVVSAIRPAIGDLEELAREASPAGMLAATILAIREGRTTPLLEELEASWRQAFSELKNSGVYQPLQSGWQREPPDDNARKHILQESNRLLSELLLQTK